MLRALGMWYSESYAKPEITKMKADCRTKTWFFIGIFEITRT